MAAYRTKASLLSLLLAGALGLGSAAGNAAVGPGLPDLGLQPAPPPSAAPGLSIPGLTPGGPVTPDRGMLSAALAAAMAADSFAALASNSVTGGAVPRQTDPMAGPLLDTVLNVDILKTKGNLGRVDLPSLLVWLGAVDKVGAVYVLAGTGATDPSPSASGPTVAAQADRNTALYSPELGRSTDAILSLSGAMAVALQSSVADIATTDAGRSGLDQVRVGIAEAISEAILTFPVPGIDSGWRQARMTTLLAVAPEVAPLLEADQCMALRGVADQTSQRLGDPPVAQGLQSFDAALKC